MSSRKRGRKPKQQRLTFEPTATKATTAGTSPTPAAAHVRFSSPPIGKEGLGVGGPSARMARTKKKAKKQPQQQTLDTALGEYRLPRTFLGPPGTTFSSIKLD